MRLTISPIPTTANSPTGPVKIKINGVIVPVAVADIELDGKVLSNPDGIVVYRDNVAFAPRLPVLGLRTLVRNNVEIVIRGKDVTITP
jgi:hypothetical protein